jgi:hypothetical protein
VSQRAIEVIVGRLITDEAFRTAFERDPYRALGELAVQGVCLTEIETAALIDTPSTLWGETGEQIHPHLHKASLR